MIAVIIGIIFGVILGLVMLFAVYLFKRRYTVSNHDTDVVAREDIDKF